MSAYYLKQVVKDWSLATIYKGMFEFMILQCIAIALIITFPAIATYLPEHLQRVAREAPVEKVEDDAASLEQDTMESMRERSQADEEAAGKKDEPAPAKQ
jgi:hypothetical protein